MKFSFIFAALLITLLSGCFLSSPSEKLMNQSSCKFGNANLKIINGKGIIDNKVVIFEFSKIDANQVSMSIVPSNVTLVVPVSKEAGYLLVNLEGQKDFVKCKL